MMDRLQVADLAVELTVAGAQDAFARGVTVEALTRAYLERIDRLNVNYTAVITINEAALDEARAIDRRRDAGEVMGPLAGIPIVIKDTMDMAGLPSTGGWHFLSSRAGGHDLVPETDAPVTQRMRAAGAIILGKTNVPVLSATGSHASDSWAGATRNVVMPDRKPGGSTAGTAAAVAASLCVLGLAEETGGSIQNPASAQDLVGVKPTFALVPNTGVMPLAGSTRDVVGPIARCVRDAAAALDVLAGYTAADPKTVAAIGKLPIRGYAAALSKEALRGKRLGLYGPGWRATPLSIEASELYARAQDELREAGAELVDDPFAGTDFASLGRPAPGLESFDARGMESLPHDLDGYLRRMGRTAWLRSYSDFAAATAAEDPFAPGGVLFYMSGLESFEACRREPDVPPDLAGFIALRERYLTIIADVMGRHRLDALVYPQMREELPALDGPGSLRETAVCEINIAGIPGVTVPAGTYASGSPFGLLFVGVEWDEARLLALAYAYEQATRHRKTPVL